LERLEHLEIYLLHYLLRIHYLGFTHLATPHFHCYLANAPLQSIYF
jgi:hypothetical protein